MRQAGNNVLITCAFLFAISSNTQAGLMEYEFHYEFRSGELFSGVLQGELQSDLDTVIVSDVLTATFSGLPGVALQTDLLESRNTVTFSGLGASFGSIAPADGLAGFSIPFDMFGGLAIISTQATILYRVEGFSPDQWSLKAKAVSLPATIWLLGISGFLLYGRRKIFFAR